MSADGLHFLCKDGELLYQVLYRKYRPKSFDDVYGQEHITTTLKNELTSGRINHAYLFTGSRGTGKTTCAKIFSKAVNCLNLKDGNPCGECDVCKGIENGDILDIVEMDAASNRKIDDIRQIIDNVQFKPTRCKYRVYIVDEVHMLTQEAFNALLKTLEEPPEHVIFILATTEVHKLPQTILSRCQRFDFHRIPTRANADRLLYVADKENVTLSDSAAMMIAGVSDGALRDSLSLLDRCIAISSEVDEEVVRNAAGLVRKTYLFELSNCIINKNTAKSLEIIDRLYGESKDMARLCNELIGHFRSLMLIKSVKNPRNILIMSDDEFEQAQTQADYLSVADIVYFMDVLSRSYQKMGKGAGDRTEFEMALVKLSNSELDATLEALTQRVSALEKAIKSGSFVSKVNVDTDNTGSKTNSANLENATQTGAQEVQIDNSIEIQKHSVSNDNTITKNNIPITKSAPKINSENKPASQQSVDEIYKNARPYVNWIEVVNNIKPISRSISAAFTGSSAYESGNYLLIDTDNDMAFKLLRNSNKRAEVKDAIFQATGKKYSLGPYKKPEKQVNDSDPLQEFVESLKDSDIEISKK